MNESVWDFDQRFKMLMAKVIFGMSDVQHKEWFIVALVPHIRIPLMHQNIATQSEAMEIEMKLEDSLVGKNGAGMNHIQLQLANLTIQLQDIKKGRENHQEIWFIYCQEL